MRVEFIKLSDQRHRLEVVVGGLRDGVELDSRSTLAETLVGPMQSVHARELAVEHFLEHGGDHLPDRFHHAFAERVLERLRRLVPHWHATPCRGGMTLDGPAPPLAARGLE